MNCYNCKIGTLDNNGKCKECGAVFLSFKSEHKSSKYRQEPETYDAFAAKIGRTYGTKYHNICIEEFAKYEEAKKDGREALDGYINETIHRIRNSRLITNTEN